METPSNKRRNVINILVLIVSLFLVCGLLYYSEWSMNKTEQDLANRSKDWRSYSVRDKRIYYLSVYQIYEADIDTFDELEDGWAFDKNYLYSGYVAVPDVDIDTLEKDIYYIYDKDKAWYVDSNEYKFLGKIDRGTIKINLEYLLDKDNVYYLGNKIEGVDVQTVNILNYLYIKDKDNVYYKGSAIVGADPVSFELIDGLYARDKNSLYFEGKISNKYDRESYTILGSYYSKDKNGIYSFGNMIEVDKPNSFVILDDERIGYDGVSLYLEGEKVPVILDPETVEIVGSRFDSYIKDKENVYRLTQEFGPGLESKYFYYLLENVAGKDFKVLTGCYQVETSVGAYYSDGSHVIVGKNILEYIDLESFVDLGSYSLEGEVPGAIFYSKDKNDVYCGCGKKLNADVNTFRHIKDGYSLDDKSVWYQCEKIVDADPQTFSMLEYGYTKDANNVYVAWTKVKGADAKTFTINGSIISDINCKEYYPYVGHCRLRE